MYYVIELIIINKKKTFFFERKLKVKMMKSVFWCFGVIIWYVFVMFIYVCMNGVAHASFRFSLNVRREMISQNPFGLFIIIWSIIDLMDGLFIIWIHTFELYQSSFKWIYIFELLSYIIIILGLRKSIYELNNIIQRYSEIMKYSQTNKLNAIKKWETFHINDIYNVQCSICLTNIYQISDIQLLRCGHSFCEYCLRIYETYNSDFDPIFKCAYCRQKYVKNKTSWNYNPIYYYPKHFQLNGYQDLNNKYRYYSDKNNSIQDPNVMELVCMLDKLSLQPKIMKH